MTIKPGHIQRRTNRGESHLDTRPPARIVEGTKIGKEKTQEKKHSYLQIPGGNQVESCIYSIISTEPSPCAQNWGGHQEYKRSRIRFHLCGPVGNTGGW